MHVTQPTKRVMLFFVLVLSMMLLSISVGAQQQRPGQRGNVPAVRPEIPTNQWVVKVAPGSNPAAIATAANMTFLGQVPNVPGLYLFEKPGMNPRDVANARAISNGLRNAPGVMDAEQDVFRHYETRAIGDDPLYFDQWHINNTGQGGGTVGEDANVYDAWISGYTGNGVVVASVDDGVWGNNPDLDGNFRADLSYNFLTDSTNVATGWHGTSVAGVMAADNDTNCGIGVAYNSGVAGIQIFGIPGSEVAQGLNYKNSQIHIYNNSWGPSDNGAAWGGAGLAELDALANGTTNGRNGKGSIYVWAAGNGRNNGDHSGADAFVNSRYNIAVAASTNFGTQASYSENGAGLVVNAPSNGGTRGITTTNGAASGCTDSFGGTSSAAPLVAGVAALMLEANPNLTWRDVIGVLIESAEKNAPSDLDWTTNGAGFDVNHKYGFGRVDAAAAVQLAKNWTNLDTETSYTSPVKNVNAAIPANGSTLSSDIYVSDDIKIESVEVIVNARHNYRGDIVLELVSPDGTVSTLLGARANDGDSDSTTIQRIDNYSFLTMRNWQEMSEGTWTLRVKDAYTPADNDGVLENWQLKIHGTETIDIQDPGATNLVQNGGFEAGKDAFNNPIGWEIQNFPKAKVKCNKIDKTFTPYNNCALQAVGTDALVKGKIKYVLDSTDFGTYPVGTYDWLQLRYQLWAKKLPANLNFVKIVIIFSNVDPSTGKNYKQRAKYPIIDNNGVWTERLHPAFTVLPGAGSIEKIKLIYFWKRQEGKFRIDNVELRWTDISALRNGENLNNTRNEALPLPEAPSGFRD